jgi:pilus assembly protein Flp/PilA
MERISNFLQDESGASAVEYALLVALIAVVCIYAIQMLGINIDAAFTTVANAISAAS